MKAPKKPEKPKRQWIRPRICGQYAGTAYIELPGYRSEPGIVKKTIRIESIIAKYKGPMVNLCFNADGRLIGIEILVFEGDKVRD